MVTDEQFRLATTGCIILLTCVGVAMMIDSMWTSSELRKAATSLRQPQSVAHTAN